MTDPDWLAGLEPPVPETFRGWLSLPDPPAGRVVRGGGASGPAEEAGGGSAGRLPAAERLERAALECLARALAPEGRERGGAFDLLAADAFVTWTAEAALDGEDPEARLRSLVRRVSSVPHP